MKILFVTTEYPPFVVGGLGVYSGNVAGQLARKHDVTVLCPGPESKDYGGNPRIARIKSTIYGYSSDNEFLYGAKQFIDSHDFDVAVCNDVHTAKIGMYLKSKGKKVVFILHRSSFRDSPDLHKLEKQMIKEADRVVTISKLMREMFAPGADIVYNGLDSGVEDKASDHILVISRNSFEKKLNSLLNIDFKIPVYVIGAGTESIRSGNVIGLGYVSDEMKNDLLSRARFVLHPADIEPFGLAILEAVYSKKPVVALGRTGAEEIVPVLKGIEWVSKLMDDRVLMEKKAELESVRIRKWEDVATDLEKVLEKVISYP